LNNLKCEYYIHEHPALKTVEESKILRGKMEGGHSKNLFLRDKKKNNFLITACEDQKIDLKDLEKKLGTSRLSFGSPDRLYQFLGVKPGSVSPLALINDQQNEVSFYIDKNLLKEKILNFHPLINNLTISLKTKDFEKFLHSIKRAYNELFFK
tara:strand:+ start:173 stop:631 length:459 start_codon:yes stop_codon:yes gene_type:complete